MNGYVLAQVQVRWGNEHLRRFNEAMTVLVRLMAQQGVVLRHGMLTTYGGHLYEVWNLWEVEDAEHMARARRALRELDEYHRMHAILSEVVEAEQIRYVEELPYAP